MAAFQFARRNKFGAKAADGFGSKLEKAVHQKLLDQQTLGLISDIKRQQTLVLQDGPRDERITWRVDFTYRQNDTGETVAVEAKGFPTADYKLKLKLFRGNPPMRLEIWAGDYKRPKLVEIVMRKDAP
jgi:hypothetical protein